MVMMSKVLFKGIIPALISPIDENGDIKEDTARKLIDWQLNAGVDGFYVCGATGEGIVMKPSARKRLVEIAVETTKGRGVVISHVGAADLATAANLAVHAAKVGANAVASVPPFFYNYALPEIKNYYAAIACASGLPTLIYASPLAGTTFTRDMIESIMEIDGVSGLKWTNPDYYEMSRIKQINGGDINVLNGPDQTLLCGLCMGADGGIGGTYNVVPKCYVELYKYFLAGNLKAACAKQLEINKIIDLLLEFDFIAGVKEALSYIGFDIGYCIPPLKKFTEAERKAFRNRLDDMEYKLNYIDGEPGTVIVHKDKN